MENEVKQVVLSVEVQQAVGKLNVRFTDFVEQMNNVINMLVSENIALRAKLEQVQPEQQVTEDPKK
jgi:hypothetical protein